MKTTEHFKNTIETYLRDKAECTPYPKADDGLIFSFFLIAPKVFRELSGLLFFGEKANKEKKEKKFAGTEWILTKL